MIDTAPDTPERRMWRYCLTFENVQGELLYGVRELYTHADGALSWTRSHLVAGEDTPEELLTTLTRMITDITTRPMLDLTQDPPTLTTTPLHGQGDTAPH